MKYEIIPLSDVLLCYYDYIQEVKAGAETIIHLTDDTTKHSATILNVD